MQEHKSTSHAITLIDAYFYHLSTMSAGKSEQSIVNKESAGALLLLPGGAGAGGDTYSVSEQVYIDSGNEKKVLYLLCIVLGIISTTIMNNTNLCFH